jgi:hypothetical protein
VHLSAAVLFRLALSVLLVASAGCTILQDATTRLPGPRLYEKGAVLIDGIRDFERRIGFRATDNFQNLDQATESYPFCGFVSQLYLPYSYQDPAIQWRNVANEAECRDLAGMGADFYFGQTEALGEMGTPVTTSMLAGSLVRFVYLIFHEDCHDQFDLPFGIEEPLCNVIAYNAMAAYAAERERFNAIERVAMRRYAERESVRTRAAKANYGQLEALYARYARGELAAQALLEERVRILARAERTLAWEGGLLNNVGIANDMTYSRHFPFLEDVFIALGRDLGTTVAFFRKVDAMKPARAAFLKQHRLKSEQSLEFVRAYEEAVLETVRKELAAIGKSVAK